jgi:hypothetical protein
MSDTPEYLPRPTDNFDSYLARVMPGVHATFQREDLTVWEHQLLLYGMQNAAFLRLFEDHVEARSVNFAKRLIVLSELEAAERTLRDSGGDDFEPEGDHDPAA